MTTVLMAVTAARHWTLTDGTKHPTGFWAVEFLAPYDIFTGAGFDVTVATPGAATPVVDELSLGLTGGILPHTVKKFRARLEELTDVLENPSDLHTVNQEDYDLVFYPGGHGPMEDLAVDEVSGKILSDRLASGRPLALLCHAPAALLATVDEDGTTPFAGKQVTGLSNREELINSFAKKAPWLVEDKLKEVGVDYSKALLPFRPHVIRDGNLYTGQNPQSSKKLAETLVSALS
ncbi:MAG TPA: type 1 glutamine amidotransferase domain-containing protein [Candidatus Corynebacterium avicola]|uniref:Type 1 glutamine amidotransferase domain-containing protein n=1 Tax=Candidatus Corynebacterium avicola TaxID=2838527 RepID=A0A9D1UL53_9CORY|nr:type 1 glutamine amidotransferase domain-containing protein [Candidatus Corynebacterium avicola]